MFIHLGRATGVEYASVLTSIGAQEKYEASKEIAVSTTPMSHLCGAHNAIQLIQALSQCRTSTVVTTMGLQPTETLPQRNGVLEFSYVKLA